MRQTCTGGNVRYDGTSLKAPDGTTISAGLTTQDVLDMNVARFDANGSLVDKNNVIMSGTPTAADWATLLSTYPAASNTDLFVLVQNIGPSGTLFHSDGTNYIPANGEYILGKLNTATRKFVCANAGITWTAATNAGKVRLTASAAHGLTAVNSDNAYMYLISGGLGWTAGTLHRITYFSATQIDLPDTTYVTSMGVPVFALAGNGTTVVGDNVIVATLTVPPLLANSCVETDHSAGNNGLNTKTFGWKFGSTLFTNNTQGAGTNDYFRQLHGIRNNNSLTAQNAIMVYNNASGTGNVTTGTIATGTENTANSTTLQLVYAFAAADETAELLWYRVRVIG